MNQDQSTHGSSTAEASTAAHPRLGADVRYRRLAGETVVVRQQAGEVLVLDEIGGRILEWVDRGVMQGRGLGHLIASLQQEFDVSSQQLEADVREFLHQLQDAGVLEPRREARRGDVEEPPGAPQGGER
ncbi:MAG: PqqD family protein [Acidobacteria bacterium]|nr:MAG: PqqD family protein [Acidobacteriota bacterium]REK10144.1 MAG: PqqD family protein [Acidobacteriota bacterium]